MTFLDTLKKEFEYLRRSGSWHKGLIQNVDRVLGKQGSDVVLLLVTCHVSVSLPSFEDYLTVVFCERHKTQIIATRLSTKVHAPILQNTLGGNVLPLLCIMESNCHFKLMDTPSTCLDS